MHLAHTAIEQGDTPDAAELLALYEPPAKWSDLRGFEWHYLKQRLHSEKFLLRTGGGEAFAVAFSPDGHVLATGGEDGKITLWDPATARQLDEFTAHSSCVNKIAYSPDGRLMASGSCDNTVRLWDALSHQELATLLAHDHFIGTVSFSPDGELLAATSDDGLLAVWDTASHRLVHKVKLPGLALWLAWSPDGTRLATSTFAVSQVWERGTWRELCPPSLRCPAGIYCRDSRRLLIVDFSNTLTLWEPENGDLRTPLHTAVMNQTILCDSPSGQWLALCEQTANLQIFEAPALVAGHVDKTMLRTGPRMIEFPRTFAGHLATIKDVAFSPDETLVVSARATAPCGSGRWHAQPGRFRYCRWRCDLPKGSPRRSP